jgi:hypothetical protein
MQFVGGDGQDEENYERIIAAQENLSKQQRAAGINAQVVALELVSLARCLSVFVYNLQTPWYSV